MPSARLLLPSAVLCVVLVAAFLLAGPRPEPRAAAAAPLGITLSAEEKRVWSPLPVSRTAIPVLLYHGIGEPSEFGNPADAAFALTRANFEKQMALLRAAGHETVTLDEFRRFHAGEPVDLPPHPVLLTFDDGLLGSLDGADRVLHGLGWTAVMFVDVGAVEAGAPGYATWDRLRAAQRSGRWELQLHAGRGHHNIAYDEGTSGPFYAYRVAGRESLDAWWRRVLRDVEWGQARMSAEVPGYRPLAFAPPYGNFGQIATNDPRIPDRLGGWLRDRFGLVFVQEPARYAVPGDAYVPRLQLMAKTTGGELRDWLARGVDSRPR